MTSDLIALILQASGGALSSTAKSKTSSNTGRYIMIAGLVWQVVSIIIFMAIWLDFSWTVSRATEDEKSHNEKLRSLRADSKRFKYFQWALWTATILILIRSIYRVVELQGGYTGTVASDEPSFIVLEGVLIVLAVILLTVLHPAYAFGGQWDSATWSLTGKTIEAEYAPVSPTELRTIKVQSV